MDISMCSISFLAQIVMKNLKKSSISLYLQYIYFFVGSMKKIALVILVVFYSLPLLSFAQDSWGKYGQNPIQILDTVVGQANEDYKIQQTALDSGTALQ